MKAPVHDVDITRGTSFCGHGEGFIWRGRLPPAAAVGVQDDDHDDIEVDVVGGRQFRGEQWR